MKVLGIIAEYNPFHNGHLYHLNESKKIIHTDFTVCIMSGNFTQRGEPAMANKWIRSRMAVDNGIDLVFELPFAFACNNAEYFAKGAVDILNSLGCISHLSFGSETGEIDVLNEAAEHLAVESEELSFYIKEFVNQGISYPRARYEAMKKYAGDQCSEVLKDANNILAVEYLKQLKLLNSNMKPITVKRYGTGYHDKHTYKNIASATAIRDKIRVNQDFNDVYEFLPKETAHILNTLDINRNVSMNDFYELILYNIINSDCNKLSNIFSATEGLENRVIKAIFKASDAESLMKAIKSKRYTTTRIQRLLTHSLLNLDKDSFHDILNQKAIYARVLAFNKKGAMLLKHIKKNELNSIPIITNINKEISKDSKEWKLLFYDIKASDIYNLVIYGEINTHSDFIKNPYKDFV